MYRYSPRRVRKDEHDWNRSIVKVNKSIDVCAEQKVNIGINGDGESMNDTNKGANADSYL